MIFGNGIRRWKLVFGLEEEIKNAFGDENIIVFSEPKEFHKFLEQHNWDKSVLLMMSSGNYGGLNWETLKNSVLNF
ncbi:MAG: hypothetical protein ACPHVX_07660, partial [Flavobacteriaceae bacterium]